MFRIRDNLNLATDIQTTATETITATQNNMARITERIIELRVRVRNSLETIDHLLADLSGFEPQLPAGDARWEAMLNLLDDDDTPATRPTIGDLLATAERIE